jgi:hypothetical protein
VNSERENMANGRSSGPYRTPADLAAQGPFSCRTTRNSTSLDACRGPAPSRRDQLQKPWLPSTMPGKRQAEAEDMCTIRRRYRYLA